MLFLQCSRLARASTSKSLNCVARQCYSKERIPKFSESIAYQGQDKPPSGPTSSNIKWQMRPMRNSNTTKKLLVGTVSFAILFAYLYYFHEEDEYIKTVLDLPPDVHQAFIGRQKLLLDIEKRKKVGQDTATLEAELEYLEVELNAAASRTLKDKK